MKCVKVDLCIFNFVGLTNDGMKYLFATKLLLVTILYILPKGAKNFSLIVLCFRNSLSCIYSSLLHLLKSTKKFSRIPVT